MNKFNDIDINTLDLISGMYIHIPFCVKKCNYCDFYSTTPNVDSFIIDEYINHLVLSIRRYCKYFNTSALSTIYIGGGTPTYIGNKRLSSLLYGLSLSINLAQIKEFSIEANPESITKSLIKDIYALGVNRISIGIQSLDDEVLPILGRPHNVDNALSAINLSRMRFDNINVDVICGIPGQSEYSLIETLYKLIVLDIPHISVYPLSVEPSTPLEKMIKKGQIKNINSDEQANHMELAEDILLSAGYKHYEISNYAKDGFFCQHNLNYWKSHPYLGIGDSAVSMLQNKNQRFRIKFPLDIFNKINSNQKILHPMHCLRDENVDDVLNKKQMICEDLMLISRTNLGISNELYFNAKKFIPSIDLVFNRLVDIGLLKKTNNKYTRFQVTKQGWMCGNDLFEKLMNAYL